MMKKQKELTAKIEELENFITKTEHESLNVNFFLNLVRKYTDIQKLDAEIIRTFVDRIYVEKPEKIPGTKTKKQTIWIQWNYIAAIDIPPNKEKSA